MSVKPFIKAPVTKPKVIPIADALAEQDAFMKRQEAKEKAYRKKQEEEDDLPTRVDVEALCNLGARVYHTDKPYKKYGKTRTPSRGVVYELVTRVRAKLGGLP